MLSDKEKQIRYIRYLNQQAISVFLKVSDRRFYKMALEEELEKMKRGLGKYQY